MSKPSIATATAAAAAATSVTPAPSRPEKRARSRKSVVAAELEQVAQGGHQLADWISLLDQQRAQSDGVDDVIVDLYLQVRAVVHTLLLMRCVHRRDPV